MNDASPDVDKAKDSSQPELLISKSNILQLGGRPHTARNAFGYILPLKSICAQKGRCSKSVHSQSHNLRQERQEKWTQHSKALLVGIASLKSVVLLLSHNSVLLSFTY